MSVFRRKGEITDSPPPLLVFHISGFLVFSSQNQIPPKPKPKPPFLHGSLLYSPLPGLGFSQFVGICRSSEISFGSSEIPSWICVFFLIPCRIGFGSPRGMRGRGNFGESECVITERFIFFLVSVVSISDLWVSTGAMGYLNPVLSTSGAQVEDSPVSGGGLRWVDSNLLIFCLYCNGFYLGFDYSCFV